MTENEEIDIITVNKNMKESAEKRIKVNIKIMKEEEKEEKWMPKKGIKKETQK